MPKQFRVTRAINAPADKIWSLLTNAPGYRSWNPSIIRLNGQIIEGAKITLVSAIDPKRTFKLTVTELTKPTRMVWSSGMPLELFTGRRTFTLTEHDSHTEFSMAETFTGALAGLITKAIPDLTDSFNQFTDSLKAASE